MELAECSLVSSHVPILKHKAKHRYITRMRLFVCFVKQLKEQRSPESFGCHNNAAEHRI